MTAALTAGRACYLPENVTIKDERYDIKFQTRGFGFMGKFS